MSHSRKIAVIGLGYVGLPVAVAFAGAGASVIGYDIDAVRIKELRAGHDRTHEVPADRLLHRSLCYSNDPSQLSYADFFIVTVPTPIDAARRPSLAPLFKASETVGRFLKSGDIVVYESTVYPGATEEECVPLLEKYSGLRVGIEFSVGYSPERINPGDPAHRFETIKKVIAGQDLKTTEIIAAVYGSVVSAGIHRAPSIMVAETAKVIENTQRDLNIALMNELSAICHALDIDTNDVLAAAQTKWNFLPFTPGLVGGHCIGVDPYYLTHRAERAGYHPEVILAGRRINDGIGHRIARECIRRMLLLQSDAKLAIILGLTFKENVPDIRNSKVVDIVRQLQSHGVEVQVHDPLALREDAAQEYGIELVEYDALRPAEAVILAVPHHNYLAGGWSSITRLLKNARGVVIDVKGKLDRITKPANIDLWRL